MTISWNAIPLNREIISNLEAIEWLNNYGISLSSSFEFSRSPTRNEIRQVLDNLVGYKTIYFVSQSQWTAYISSVFPKTREFLNTGTF